MLEKTERKYLYMSKHVKAGQKKSFEILLSPFCCQNNNAMGVAG